MRNIWLIIRHEVGVILRQRSFWIVALLVPFMLVGLQAVLAFQEKEIGRSMAAQSAQEPSADVPRIGLVEAGGWLAKLPPGVPADLFVRFADEASAQAALKAGQIEQYVYVPADYLESGRVIIVDHDFQILRGGAEGGLAFNGGNAWMLDAILNYNLSGDAQLIDALRNPTPGDRVVQHTLNPPQPNARAEHELADVVSRVLPYIYYFLLMMGASYLMRSVVAEKENRTAEVLLVSLDPRELMVGKIVAMSVVMLIQLAIWVAGGTLALEGGADLLQVTRFSFPQGFLVWAVLFLVLGYLLFASIMSAAGAIATSAREANQVTWLLVIPLMPTLLFGPMLLENPDSPFVVFLSLFPFSSPSAMVTRLAVQPVPPWQIGISLLLLAATTYGMIALSARFFRPSHLLSAESFNWRRFGLGWRRGA